MYGYKKARDEVAKLLNIDLKKLTYILYKNRDLYKSFSIPKKNGEFRVIHAPKQKLKNIQRKLSNKLNDIHVNYLKNNNIKSIISHGFEKGKSIITNASVHKNKKYILNIDILDFFPSFHFGRVLGYFYKSKEFGFSEEVATIIAQLVCYNGALPQGAPTSPLISNLIFNIVDMHIWELAKKYKLNYTRYADDMSFSTNNGEFKKTYISFINELSMILKKDGFVINQHKTRFEYFSSRQEVTGLTVNDKVNVNRLFIKKTRAMVNRLFETDTFMINDEIGTLNQLEGRLSFINQLDKLNNRLKNKKPKKSQKTKLTQNLNAREKQYQYFLFYKYFFRPKMITIVTEGKTDILHIKAALMKYCNKYPRLVTLNKNGEYEFHVYFLRKTKRLEYFLGIYSDGADTMKGIFDLYADKNKCLYGYINDKNKNGITDNIKPVILLFDNENKSDKPLYTFLQHCKCPMENGTIFKHLTANLYLQTLPLVKNMEMCEIEDLYTEDVLNIEINGKRFSKNEKYNTKKYFGKKIFAMYIIKNYKDIDFCNFEKLLDSIDAISKLK